MGTELPTMQIQLYNDRRFPSNTLTFPTNQEDNTEGVIEKTTPESNNINGSSPGDLHLLMTESTHKHTDLEILQVLSTHNYTPHTHTHTHIHSHLPTHTPHTLIHTHTQRTHTLTYRIHSYTHKSSI